MSDGNEAELYSEKMTSVNSRLYTQIFIQNPEWFRFYLRTEGP